MIEYAEDPEETTGNQVDDTTTENEISAHDPESDSDHHANSAGATLTLAAIEAETGISYPSLLRYSKAHADRLPSEGSGRTRRYYPSAIEVFKEIAAEGRKGRGKKKEKNASTEKSTAKKSTSTRATAKEGAGRVIPKRPKIDPATVTPLARRGFRQVDTTTSSAVDLHFKRAQISTQISTLKDVIDELNMKVEDLQTELDNL